MRRKLLVGHKLLFGLLAISALITEVVVLIERGTFNPANFFSFFTVQSNIAAAIILLASALMTFAGKRSKRFDFLRGAATFYMIVTGIVFAVLLAGLEGVQLTAVPWDNIVLHYIIPIVMAADWLLDPPAERIPYRKALLWAIYPVAYLVYSLVRGSLVGWYPYPFLNPANSGYGEVTLTSLMIMAGALIGILLMTRFGRISPLKHSRKARGFTIVELLIVIVVIGVLAAIVIVAFNGIQQRAASATLQSDLRGAANQLEIARVDNNDDYPDNDEDLTKSSGTTYQYTTDGGSYCLTATSSHQGVSAYYISSATGSVQSGACSGHVSDGNELWASGWAAIDADDYDDDLSMGDGVVSMSSDQAQTGSQSLRIDYDVNVKYGLVQKEFTGLSIGEDYVVSANVYLPSGQDTDVWGGLLFIGEGPGPGNDPGSIWVAYFGGDADEYNEPNAPVWDDWSTIEVPFTATATEVWVSVGMETISPPLGAPAHIFYDNVVVNEAP